MTTFVCSCINNNEINNKFTDKKKINDEDDLYKSNDSIIGNLS